MVIAIFVNRAYHQYTRCYNFPIRTTPKKISVSKLGVIFWGSPLFLAVFGHSHFRGATTLNFGPISTKLGGTVRAIKKWPRRTTDPVRAGFTEKRAGYLLPKSGFWPKNGFYPKKSRAGWIIYHPLKTFQSSSEKINDDLLRENSKVPPQEYSSVQESLYFLFVVNKLLA